MSANLACRGCKLSILENRFAKIIFSSFKPPTNLSFQSNDFVRKIWAPRPIISTGGYDRKLAMEVADNQGDLIAFGRSFIANVSASIV